MSEITQTSILRISDDKTIELIELYEQEQCLWNTSLDEYKMRDRRAKAAQRIARKLDLKNFEAKHVMIKFKNLRNSYTQELKKIANSRNAGHSGEDLYRPRVFWFSKMDSFLRPHLQRSRTNSILFDQEDSLSASEGPIITKVKSEATTSECSEPEEWVQMSNPENVLPTLTEPSSEDEEPLKPAKRPRVSEDRLEQSPSRLPHPQLQTPAHRDDQYDCFGKYIASLLRNMPAQRALELQPRIVSLVVTAAGVGDGCVSQSDGHD